MRILCNTLRRWTLASMACTIALAGCGGGGADGGIGGTGTGSVGVAYGQITGFGSVWVNGVRYETTSAQFRRDDNSSASQSDLREGMVARVEGSASPANATRVSVDSAIKGRVEQIQGDQYVVMGQTVQTDAATRFENSLRPALGDYVEVHGLVRGPGIVAASFIERKAAPVTSIFAVSGQVGVHDAAAATLTIGTLTVRYTGADAGDMPTGSWVGLQVRVKGDACAGTPVCGSLTATKIEPAGARFVTSPKAEIEGFVASLTADGFVLGDLRVVVNPATVYEDGLPADLVVGSKIEVEGPITNGVLTATKVEFRAGVRIEADVLAVTGDRITLTGLPGVEVQVTSQTELDGLASLAALAPGQHLRLRGRPVGASLIVAIRLELRSADTEVELRASVSAAADPVLTLLGVSIDTTGLPDSAFRQHDVVIGRAAFFAALTGGRPVAAKGTRSGSGVVWRELELED